jgi:hypothetical protein
MYCLTFVEHGPFVTTKDWHLHWAVACIPPRFDAPSLSRHPCLLCPLSTMTCTISSNSDLCACAANIPPGERIHCEGGPLGLTNPAVATPVRTNRKERLTWCAVLEQRLARYCVRQRSPAKNCGSQEPWLACPVEPSVNYLAIRSCISFHQGTAEWNKSEGVVLYT